MNCISILPMNYKFTHIIAFCTMNMHHSLRSPYLKKGTYIYMCAHTHICILYSHGILEHALITRERRKRELTCRVDKWKRVKCSEDPQNRWAHSRNMQKLQWWMENDHLSHHWYALYVVYKLNFWNNQHNFSQTSLYMWFQSEGCRECFGYMLVNRKLFFSSWWTTYGHVFHYFFFLVSKHWEIRYLINTGTVPDHSLVLWDWSYALQRTVCTNLLIILGFSSAWYSQHSGVRTLLYIQNSTQSCQARTR